MLISCNEAILPQPPAEDDNHGENRHSKIRAIDAPVMARLTVPLIGTLLIASALMVVNAQQQPLDLIDRDQTPIRCSYTIYSAQFEQLPDAAKRALYQRLWTILSGTETDGRYGRLVVADRRAIVDILRATKSDLPTRFRM
jgi:hypothetical protein